ncbi:hypothetical protein O1L60_29505 [Streptomyces diastatochromogenes]|nr:hypothetical protein [Streptomyces diastatochromogenes]
MGLPLWLGIRLGPGLRGVAVGRRGLEVRVQLGEVGGERRHQLLHLLEQTLGAPAPFCSGTDWGTGCSGTARSGAASWDMAASSARAPPPRAGS